MKFILALLGLTQAIQINGIPKDDIMQNQANHWRKIWPQGNTDDGRDDDKIMFGWSEEKEDPKIRAQAHSDYVYQKIETYGHELDIVVEAKHKELAVERYYQIHG